MHGVVPKSLWQRLNPADENNMCNWAMRCLLLESNGKVVLIDNGMGDKQSEKFFGYYYLNGNDSLEKSLNKAGFTTNDVTDNFLTHLHFDHCGGGIKWNNDRTGYEPLFANANYHVNKVHWNHSLNPNAREKASFLKENLLPMQESGHLAFVEKGGDLLPELDYLLVDGHTESMMLPKIQYKDKTILFMADLCPSVAHLSIAWVMGYDIRPLDTMKERQSILQQAAQENWVLFFEHDAVNECCTVKEVDGKVKLDETFALADIL